VAYTIQFKPSALRQLERLPLAIQQRIRPRVDALTFNPRPPGCKKLAGEEELYRIRVGDYRIIYEIHDRVLVVIVVKLGHRGGVYD
jgi:mRNA interferase RelE/StbE